MKYFKIIVNFIVLGIIFNACQEDILEKYPLDQVSSADYFKQPNDLMTYMNQFYKDAFFYVPSVAGGDFDSDLQVRSETDERLQGIRTINDVSSINYSNVRKINYFFDNYEKVEANAVFDEYKQYVGEAHYFRALAYFQLLKRFGDVQWVTTELGTNSPELYEARDPRNVVVDNIIADLDTAAMYLTAKKTDGASRVNKWMALLIQSRVALYEGTWEKYHAGTPFGVSNPQPEKYFNKVIEAASAIMNSGLYNIYSTGAPLKDYHDLFSLRNYSSNKEVMCWKEYSIAKELTSNLGQNYHRARSNGNSITKQLADSYLCSDGNPITGNPLFMGYATLSDEKQNRDPRFFQTIATPEDIWKINEDGTVQYWSEFYSLLNSNSEHRSPGGYIRQKGYDPHVIYHDIRYEETPEIIYRYAEVLLNYAEAKAELGTISQNDIDKSIKKLRDRVGMPNLILANIKTDPEWEFPGLSPTINEIRRERKVELATEGFRWDDIARWAAADEIIIGTRPKGFLASQIKTNPYPVDGNGFLDPFQNAIPDGYRFVLGRDYLDPIPPQELVLNPNLGQNPGW